MSNDKFAAGIRARFVNHKITPLPGYSWKCANPETTDFHFAVTWTPGNLIVTGDLGRMIYTRAGLDSVLDAVGFAQSDIDYLCEKSPYERDYDLKGSIAHVIETAKENLDEEWEWGKIRKNAHSIDGDCPDLSNRVYLDWLHDNLYGQEGCDELECMLIEIFGDSEMLQYRWPAEACALRECLLWWGQNMQAAARES